MAALFNDYPSVFWNDVDLNKFKKRLRSLLSKKTLIITWREGDELNTLRCTILPSTDTNDNTQTSNLTVFDFKRPGWVTIPLHNVRKVEDV